MKYVKMLGLLVVAAAALMAFAGTASATLTGPSENKLHASNSGNVILTGPVTINCSTSTVGGTVSSNGENHVEGPISTLTFENCGNSTVTVVKGKLGSLTGTDAGANSTTADVYSTGAEVTVLAHIFLLGTRHCTYLTNNTTIGTLTESAGSTAKFDISATIPVEPETSDDICGEGTATWEGSYSVTNPDNLVID